MSVTVIADSAAALEPAQAARLGIVTVPMQVEIGGRALGEEELSLDDLVSHLGEDLTTSGPSPGAFLTALEEHAGSDGTLVLTVGAHLSSTYQAAVAASRMIGDSSPVRVVDTGTAAGAEGLVVMAAGELALAGHPLEAVEAEAVEVSRSVRLVAAVEELKYLAKSGRVPSLAAMAGDALGVRPMFEMRDARIRPLRPAFSAPKAAEQIVSHWRRSRPADDTPLHVAALHALRPAEAEALLETVTRECKPETSFVGTFGPVMIAHTGPGVTGLAWWWGAVDATRPAPPR